MGWGIFLSFFLSFTVRFPWNFLGCWGLRLWDCGDWNVGLWGEVEGLYNTTRVGPKGGGVNFPTRTDYADAFFVRSLGGWWGGKGGCSWLVVLVVVVERWAII